MALCAIQKQIDTMSFTPQYAVGLFSLLLLGGHGHAHSLTELWDAAQNHSAEHQVTRHRRDAAREQPYQARAALMPRLSGQLSYQYQPFASSDTRQSHGWQIQLNQTLFDASKTAQYQQSQLTAQAAEQQFVAEQENLLLQVAQTYFQLLQAQDTIATHAAEKETYAQQLKQAQHMFDVGAATALDIHEAQVGHDQALANETAAIAAQQTSAHQLANYTGLDTQSMSGIDIDDLYRRYFNKLQQHNLAYWQGHALTRNPEYQAQYLILQSSNAALSATQNQRLPKLEAAIGYQDHRHSTYSGTAHQRTRGLSASLNLHIPLYTGGETSSKIREHAARYAAESAQLMAVADKVRLAIHQAYSQSHAAHRQILAQEQLLNSSRLKLQSTQTGEQYGLRNRLEVIRARQETTQAQQQLTQAKYRFVMAYLTLIKESGLGLRSEWTQ